jgi:hypothetical protein
MPWIAIIFAEVCWRIARRLPRLWQPLLASAALVLGLVVPLAYEVAYDRSGEMHIESPAQIVTILRTGQGPIYSMNPGFALWSGRPEYAWYYAADSYIPRAVGSWKSDDFKQAFAGSRAVVLFTGELDDAPAAQSYLADNFTLAYEDAYYALWLKR